MIPGMIWKKITLLSLACTAWAIVLTAQSAHKLLREGDRQYEQSNYREAEQAYRQASEQKSAPPGAIYNTGNAVYQQGNYAASEKLFEQAAQAAGNKTMQADALYNLGNARLKQQKYQEAVQAYENSLRLRPGDPQTKVNLQLAKKKLQQEQQKQQQQNQQNQQPNQQQNQQDQQQNQQTPQQPQQNQGQNQPQDQPQQQPKDQQSRQASDGRMNPEQARRLLETAVAPEDQRNARKYREMEPGKHQKAPKKDW